MARHTAKSHKIRKVEILVIQTIIYKHVNATSTVSLSIPKYSTIVIIGATLLSDSLFNILYIFVLYSI